MLTPALVANIPNTIADFLEAKIKDSLEAHQGDRQAVIKDVSEAANRIGQSLAKMGDEILKTETQWEADATCSAEFIPDATRRFLTTIDQHTKATVESITETIAGLASCEAGEEGEVIRDLRKAAQPIEDELKKIARDILNNNNTSNLNDYIVEFLINFDDDNLSILKTLVKLGFDINQPIDSGEDLFGRTVLVHLISEAKEDEKLLNKIRILVNELGADVNQADQDGITPLAAAIDTGKGSVAELLSQELGAQARQIIEQ